MIKFSRYYTINIRNKYRFKGDSFLGIRSRWVPAHSAASSLIFYDLSISILRFVATVPNAQSLARASLAHASVHELHSFKINHKNHTSLANRFAGIPRLRIPGKSSRLMCGIIRSKFVFYTPVHSRISF